mmetsp:Transcript_18796/g.27655  ORF Transcript_18796/g.27655 Transcript_18796/m.27655 type:complete len:1366 (-) Transcript_18796:313-4410(-)
MSSRRRLLAPGLLTLGPRGCDAAVQNMSLKSTCTRQHSAWMKTCRVIFAVALFSTLIGCCTAQPTFRYGSMSWAACDTGFVDPYFPHVCRTATDASGKFEQPASMRIAVTVHSAWSISGTSDSSMITKAQSAASAAAFEAKGAPTRLNLARIQEQPKYERRIGYRRGKGASSTLVQDDSLCMIGDDVGSPACDSNFYGFMIDRISADKQLFHARYTFEITFHESNSFEVFFDGCCRLTALDNNANLPFYLYTQVQIRQGETPELSAPRSSAQFAHPDTVMLRRNGDYFVNDASDPDPCTKAAVGSNSQPTRTAFQIQAYHMDDAYGQQLRYRVATLQEMGGYKCRDSNDRCIADLITDPPSAQFEYPPGMQINSRTGEVSIGTGLPPAGPSYDGPGHGTWSVTIIVETLQCLQNLAMESCQPNAVGYSATIDFLLNIRATSTPLAFDASQPRPYFALSSPVTTRQYPIRIRCGISPELQHFDYTDPDTGIVTNLGRTLSFGFFDPDHNSCTGPGGEILENQHISSITQAHTLPAGIVLQDRSSKGSYQAVTLLQWTPRCEEVSQLGIKMVCFTARDGRNTSGFLFLDSKPSPNPSAPSCIFLNSTSPPPITAPVLLDPTSYTTCSADCCACCEEDTCACASENNCCYTMYARSGTRFSLVVRAAGSDANVAVNLSFFFPEGLHQSIEQAGMPAPVSRANKYGCASFINMVLVMPYSKADFDNPSLNKNTFKKALYHTIQDLSGPDPLPLFSELHITSVVSDQKDLSVASIEVDVVIEAVTVATGMHLSSLMLHTKILQRLTTAKINVQLALLSLKNVESVLLAPAIDHQAKQRTRDAAKDYEECVSDARASDVITLTGGSPNHVTKQFVWDIQTRTGMSCRAKNTLRWIPCTADIANTLCDQPSSCLRNRVTPFKVCYRAELQVPAMTDTALYNKVYGRPPSESSCTVCFALRIATRPFFIELQVGAGVGSTNPAEMVPLAVNKTLVIILVAADNLGLRAYIYLEENPGAPSGSSMTPSERVAYNGQQFQGDAYRRTFTFTPSVSQIGTISTVCFVAQNENDMQSSKRCYFLDVRAAVVQWRSRLIAQDGTEAEPEGPDIVMSATMGCDYRFTIEATAQLYNMDLNLQTKPECSSCVEGGIAVRNCGSATNVSLSVADEEACCGNGKCDGAEMGLTCPQDCPGSADQLTYQLSLEQTQTGVSANGFKSKALLRWRPTSGMEGRTVLLCVGAHAINQGETEAIVQTRTANNAPSLCYVITVERCAFCVQYGASFKSVSETLLFNQHWLRLYNSNPALLRPDHINATQRLAIGPIYKVASGDTILAISGMAKTTVKAILANNPDVHDASGLMPGAHLCLPLCSSPQI